MIDHIGLTVADYARSRAFYERALAPLGYRLVMELTPEQTGGSYHGGGFGDGKPDFWIGAGRDGQTPTTSMHVAFAANSRAAVDAFHAAALAAGARDNGAPGLRPDYHANYYGAFVIDPDGHNIEAVCHLPEDASR
ncbi:VOC family protein [Luteimonas wenzhouensis]|uniref:VOC family protein n=1 Tax=Luteimonas wenzhouensis TaxID=2599615 RepID=A0A5C5U771_9GAMM|nr:VOC family protein [Luteimonas wenzhouensis]TWT21579.1 VOC family protein [Luteimonas wenzhouensis]